MSENLIFAIGGFGVAITIARLVTLSRTSEFALGLETAAVCVRHLIASFTRDFPNVDRIYSAMFALGITETVIERVINLDLSHRSLTLERLLDKYSVNIGDVKELDRYINDHLKTTTEWMIKRNNGLKQKHLRALRNVSQIFEKHKNDIDNF